MKLINERRVCVQPRRRIYNQIVREACVFAVELNEILVTDSILSLNFNKIA